VGVATAGRRRGGAAAPTPAPRARDDDEAQHTFLVVVVVVVVDAPAAAADTLAANDIGIARGRGVAMDLCPMPWELCAKSCFFKHMTAQRMKGG
jgi:hypothetical protein